MHVIHARNVNDAYLKGLAFLHQEGLEESSRNGPVIRVPYPVTTAYERPQERVLMSAQRNANPFFHLFEALWMLAGRNDLATLTQFLPSFAQFSDDSITLHGAYGYRWRHWPIYDLANGPGIDQLSIAIQCLRDNPNDRRVIIGMWDPERDLDQDSKDIPCNDIIKFAIVQGSLDMQVFCRSNDIVFGAYGANAVHMSMLQEYVASMVGVPMGRYWQISADYHAYTEQPYRLASYWPTRVEPERATPYFEEIVPYPLVNEPNTFDEELSFVVNAMGDRTFASIDLRGCMNRFFPNVAQPMYIAHDLMQDKSVASGRQAMQVLRNAIRHIAVFNPSTPNRANDWLTAGHEWCSRVILKRSANPSLVDKHMTP